MTRLAKQSVLVFALAVPALASYHYVHYNGRNGPFIPLYEKFNLAALPNNTVTFFVSEQGPAVYAPNDSFGSVLSQIKQAAAAWNSVPTSDLRVAFGGLESYTPNPTVTSPGGPTLNSTTPGADIIFVDLPGVLGMGAPTTSTISVPSPTGGSFFPIVRGLVMLSRDTNRAAGPSYLEAFYTTAVHEIGHALGLQHTWTGGAMSQGVIRNTSRARPLEADDVAAISILYGKPDWQSSYGAISGRVTFTNNQPVALASVVAIAAAGPAVSTLTAPDGSYRIDGLPLNYNYSIYVHPLPPGATQSSNLRIPVDQNFQGFQASGAFQTVFYPGTLDPTHATPINVNGGAPVQNVNFTVQAQPSVTTYDVETYTFLNSASRAFVNTGDRRLSPSYVNSNQTWGLVVAQAKSPAFLPNPQAMYILGGFAPAFLNNPNQNQPTVLPYEFGTVAAYFSTFGAGLGPRHLVFNFGNDLYVLPNGVTLVQKGPPQVNAVLPNADGSVTISGAGLGLDSVVYFDGLQATGRTPIAGTDSLSTLTVIPPQGVSGQIATVAVYNSDGQNSMLLQSENPPTYLYPAAPAPLINSVSLTSLPAASAAAVEINASNTNFVDGQVTVGFGSNDVAVRRIWVLSPTRLIANVVTAPGAAVGPSQISVISGLSIIPQGGTFQTQVARFGVPALSLPVVNAETGQPAIYAGSTAILTGQNLAGAQVSLNEILVQIISATASQITFVVPGGFPAGPATLRLNSGAGAAFPVIVQIDNPPPAISGINNASGTPLSGISVSPGELLNVLVTGLDSAAAALGRVRIFVSGVEMPVQQIIALPGGVSQIQAVLTQSFGGAYVPVSVSVDGSSSAPYLILVR